MTILNLTEWAAVAEIIGTAAVVISLLFVAYTVNKNTAVMHASNENFLYEIQFARGRDIVASPGLAAIYAKRRRNEELSEEEQERFHWDKLQDLSSWELAFRRHRDGMFSTEQWEAWDKYFVVSLTGQFPEESWVEVKDWYVEGFKKACRRRVCQKVATGSTEK